MQIPGCARPNYFDYLKLYCSQVPTLHRTELFNEGRIEFLNGPIYKNICAVLIL